MTYAVGCEYPCAVAASSHSAWLPTHAPPLLSVQRPDVRASNPFAALAPRTPEAAAHAVSVRDAQQAMEAKFAAERDEAARTLQAERDAAEEERRLLASQISAHEAAAKAQLDAHVSQMRDEAVRRFLHARLLKGWERWQIGRAHV